MILYDDIPTPVGDLRVAVDDRSGSEVVVAAAFADQFDSVAARLPGGAAQTWHPAATEASDLLARYVGGELDALDAIAVECAGTAFQRRVWAALRTIPRGVTWTYRDLAAAVDSPRGFQAVGQANGRNPVSVIVPCHRVVAADNTLGGYAGGLERKRWLLVHEGVLLTDS